MIYSSSRHVSWADITAVGRPEVAYQVTLEPGIGPRT